MDVVLKNKRLRGISLIEMAVFIVIIGFLIISASRIYLVQVRYEAETVTTERLQTIKAAMEDYIARNKRMPCIASRIAPIDDENFGIEQQFGAPDWDPGCDNEDPSDWEKFIAPSDNSSALFFIAQFRSVRIGAVPVRTLGLSDEMMFDGWGNRLVYAMVPKMLSSYGWDDYLFPVEYNESGAVIGTGVVNLLKIEDADGNDLTNIDAGEGVVWLVLAPGEDGRGAYGRNGGNTPISPCPTSGAAEENCNDDNVFISQVRKNYSTGNNRFTSTLVYGTDFWRY